MHYFLLCLQGIKSGRPANCDVYPGSGRRRDKGDNDGPLGCEVDLCAATALVCRAGQYCPQPTVPALFPCKDHLKTKRGQTFWPPPLVFCNIQLFLGAGGDRIVAIRRSFYWFFYHATFDMYPHSYPQKVMQPDFQILPHRLPMPTLNLFFPSFKDVQLAAPYNRCLA
jgi:hypothetical protein